MLNYKNLNYTEIVTLVDVNQLEQLLVDSQYDPAETEFVIKGFKEGFPQEYHRSRDRRDTARNLKLRVGTHYDLWNIVMNEVQLGRFVGPFEQIPFNNFIQSPIGLVGKSDGGLCLIFHLSYDFNNANDRDETNANKHKSVNFHTPPPGIMLCEVQ